MTHAGHSHSFDLSGEEAPVASKRVTRIMWGSIGAILLLALIGLVTLWPSGDTGRTPDNGLQASIVDALVQSVSIEPCSYDATTNCRMVTGSVTEGEQSGDTFTLEQTALGVGRQPEADDDIRISVVVTDDGQSLFDFYDYQRSGSLIWLTLVFAAAVIVLGRRRGVGALAGLAASIVLLIVFMVPALLDGANAVLVSIVAAVLIATIALLLAHGINIATAVALLSTFAALAFTGMLAYAFIRIGNLTGFADESTLFLSALDVPIDPRGLLLAGIVIGALGVLDDVTVTQVSAVWELRRSHPDAQAYSIYERAVRIGRDHISSTVNTLFLAYAGASLSLLLLFAETGRGLGSIATSEIVATEIVRALVGSIGLVSSVPIATWLAAVTLRTRNGPHPPPLRYPKPTSARPARSADD